MNNTTIDGNEPTEKMISSPNTGEEAASEASHKKREIHAFRLSALQDLKAIFLAMDWEINDQTLSKLIGESDKLMDSSKGDLVLVAYFKMLSSLGKYIKVHKANSDKDAVGLLNSVYDSMEKVIAAEEMTYSERERLVIDEINKFKVLKQKITGKKGGRVIRKKTKKSPNDAVIASIKAEMASLRQEVADLREQIDMVLASLDR